jgi:two-component system, sensor histidine kinase and response regulator
MNGPVVSHILEEMIDALPETAARGSLRREAERLQAENTRLLAELNHTVELNDLFAGILSHDLRNPLGAILMSATVMSRKADDENLKRSLARILTAGSRMNQMIAQLLDFTRARSAGGLHIERKRADAVPLVRQVVDELSGGAGGRPIAFEHTGDAHGGWDAARLTQAASHLVGNALRHGTPGGAIGVRIDGRDPLRVMIEVRSAGAVPSELLPVLFKPFQNGEMGTRRGGLGLGLFVTREIVAAHGGTLEVASANDITTFTVSLPRGDP